jgi:hypothetical protein
VVVLLGAGLVGVRLLSGGPAEVRTLPSPTPVVPTLPTLPGLPGAPTAPAEPLGTLTPTALQCGGGVPGLRDVHGARMTGGGLSVPTLLKQGYRYSASAGLGFPFASDAVGTMRQVARGWVSVVLVGGLSRANGFRSPEAAARAVMVCIANDPSSYQGAYALDETDGRRTTVDGRPAYDLTEDVKVHQPGLSVPGDTVRVIVVDTGNPRTYGIFMMMTPLGDPSYAALQKQAAAQLRVE